MAQATNDEIQVTLSKMLSKLELLEKKRKFNRNLNLLLSALILCVFLTFGYNLGKPFCEIDPTVVFSGVSRSVLVQASLNKSVREAARDLVPALRKDFFYPLIRDPELLRTISSEADAFVQVAEHDISQALGPLYANLMASQKQYLEQTFPEIKKSQAIDKAMDHLIQIGAPKIKASFIRAFQGHIQILLAIHSKIQGLKDDSLKNLPSLEKAVLGVTLELFGRLLREEGEKAK